MTKEKLKPCPFCGSSDVKVLDIGQIFKVQCKVCFVDINGYWTREEAERVWNTRAGEKTE